MINLFMLGQLFEATGTILLGVLVLLVHHKMEKEHKIDRKVVREIKIEEVLGIMSIALIAIGFVMQIITL